MPPEPWFDRADRAFKEGTLAAHARALRGEGLPAARVAIALFVSLPRELRVRGRGDDVPRLLGVAPEVLEALGVPLARLEQALAERSLARLVMTLHEEDAWPKGRIVAALQTFSVVLEATGRDDEPVLAELDRLTGFAPRERQLWPEEPETD